jgi:hypothetical protein
MTNDQWKIFEQSIHMAPEIVQSMYTLRYPEMSERESIDLARVLLSNSQVLQHLQSGGTLSPDDMEMAMQTTFSTLAGLYGRLMGLAKAYDTLITKQVVLEAELAASGK